MTRCALCGYEFDERALACHSQCPMSEGCAIICCPNCGYQAVDESKAWGVTLLRKAFSRLKVSRLKEASTGKAAKPTRNNHLPAIRNLTDLLPGQSAEVVEIASADAGRLLTLSALGIAPGSVIRLQQRSPACIVWVGETQLSLDAEVAREILLRVTPEKAGRPE